MVEIFTISSAAFSDRQNLLKARYYQLCATRIDLDLIIMPVQIFAFSLVAAQLVRAGKIAFDHYFVK